MSRNLSLRVTTPLAVVVEEERVASVRAEDESGGFGIQPGHADFLTVLGASVLRWRGAGEVWHYCALRGGVLRVIAGERVEVVCREAVRGDDLSVLAALVKKADADQDDAARRARAAQTRLHASAIRGLMRTLGSDPDMRNLAEDLQ